MNSQNTDKIKILIADDHAVVRQGLKQMFADTSDLVVFGEAKNGQEVLDQVRKNDFDLVLLDVGMPDKSGLDVLKQLKSEFSSLPVLILSMYPEDRFEERFLRAGASAYLTKESDTEQLINAVRKVSRGEKFVSSYLAGKMAFNLKKHSEEPPHESLSDREFQVMCMIASGKNLMKIAENLCLSITTVSIYKTRILEKMQMENNIQLTHYVLENKLLD